MNKAGLLFLTVLLATLSAFACGDNGKDSANESPTTTKESSEVEKARDVVRDVADGKYAEVRSLFDEGLLAALSLDQLKQGWESFVLLKGDYRSQGEAEVVARSNITVVDIGLVMVDEPGIARVTFDKQGKIAGLFFLAEDIPVP